MSNKFDAAAKDAEGKIQSAVGSLTGDKGQQLKGEAKQVQADAMKAVAKLKEEAKKAASKLADATE
ncbi:CsbD family protein [Cyanobium sp. AMD-g]|uniref:CsbD family protein n=1 Tax=Cyanobium sp. AMD-g TaxID=2823699 RepID=UPI0020CCDFBE|nr:CsbD family protein [Cyanobium sp. AMD-g]MCP9929175.1 CsbD family protein [Cyanobium sp. AMD-g]